MSYRRTIGGDGGGITLHAENLHPTYPQRTRGAKRALEEAFAAPSAKRSNSRVKDLKSEQPSRTVELRRALRVQISNTVSTCKRQPKADISKKTQRSKAGGKLVHPVQNLNQSTTQKKLKKMMCTNVMVDISAVRPLDYYAAKCDLPPGVPDMDLRLIDDPNCEAQYAHDVFTYLRTREKLFTVTSYIHKQAEMSPFYRAWLVDWMVELQEIFELNHETLYLAVKIVDLYLSRRTIRKVEVQLLGATAVLIASKVDDRTPPSVHEFVRVCNKTYDKMTFLDMERHVLATLDFDLSMPLSYSFLRRFCRSIEMDMRDMTLARFILECSLMEYSMVGVPESRVAAGALLLALQILGRKWNDTLTYYTGYEERELVSVRNALNKLVHKLKRSIQEDKKSTRVIVDKYSHEVFYKVAEMNFPPVE